MAPGPLGMYVCMHIHLHVLFLTIDQRSYRCTGSRAVESVGVGEPESVGLGNFDRSRSR